jgi:predicted ArsR family transcriptional regulator
MIPTPQFWQSTRGKLVTLLRQAKRTVTELAEHLGLTDNAVRSHLLALERDGLAKLAGQRPGTRRPNYLYQLTPDAEQLFPKAYAPVLTAVLHQLGDQLPPEARQRLLQETGGRLAQPYRDDLAHLPFPDRLSRVLGLLQSLGASAEIQQEQGDGHGNEQGGQGTLSIQGNACPLAKVVRGSDDPAGCLIMQAMLEELLGVPVTEKCQRGESPRCCFVLTPPAAKAP